MRQLWTAALLLLAFGTLAACRTPRAGETKPVSLAITNVTVIDPETKRVLPDHSVCVDEGRIVAVVPSSKRRSYVARSTLDGSGQFLIPGLMDMHSHLLLPEPSTPTLNLLLANGVTSIREMSGDCWETAGAREGCIGAFRDLQGKLQAGEVAGPELVSISSAMVMGPAFAAVPEGVDPFIVPRTPEEARRLVRYLKGRSVDLIKTHDGIPTAVFAALGEEARAVGLEVSGHVPFGVNVTELARHGFGSIEHARDLLYDCSRYGAEYRRLTSDFAESKPGARGPAAGQRHTHAPHARGVRPRVLPRRSREAGAEPDLLRPHPCHARNGCSCGGPRLPRGRTAEIHPVGA